MYLIINEQNNNNKICDKKGMKKKSNIHTMSNTKKKTKKKGVHEDGQIELIKTK